MAAMTSSIPPRQSRIQTVSLGARTVVSAPCAFACVFEFTLTTSDRLKELQRREGRPNKERPPLTSSDWGDAVA